MSVRAIMVVHIYGRRVNMDLIHTFAKKYGLFVIEDLAEAHGVKPHPETHAVCHSFYKNKIIAGEEGGAVWFRDHKHAALARQLRSLGFTDAHDFNHVPRGHNYRMSNLHADCIMRYPIWCSPESHNPTAFYWRHCVKERRKIESTYEMYCPPKYRMPPRQAPWVYDLRIKGMTSVQQDKVVKTLQEADITARHGFKPMHSQEEFSRFKTVSERRYVYKSNDASAQVIYLPIQPGVTTEASCRLAFEIISKVIS